MNGLHSCKPGNEPQVGQVKNFVVISNPANGGKKAWTKIKSASADQGGKPYKITSVKPTGFTDSYGNVSFNLDLEPANGSSDPSSHQPHPAASALGRGISKPPSSNVGKEGYWDRKEAADIAKQPRIERQHAQEMAIRYCALKGTTLTTEELRTLIDWFQRDVGHVPDSAKQETPPDVEYQQGDPADEEIPF